MTGNERDEYLKSLEKYIEEIKKNRLSSFQRIDTLSIVMSTSSIFLLASLMTGENGKLYQILQLKITILLFAATIVFNLVNHLISNICHSMVEKITMKKINSLKEGIDQIDQKYERMEKVIGVWLNEVIIMVNYFALLFLITGVGLGVLSFVSL